jgi:hypothetical protein
MPTTLQSKYVPLSGFPSMETVCPSNLVEPLQTAFNTLSTDIGDVDSYVLSKLGYSERKALDYLAAEQIDAIALAIWNIERGEGFICGSQTGIGKGRIAAAIMRYALRNGRIPIFITDNTKLYKDIVRDLWDINSTGIQPLITDANLLVELPDGTTYKTPAATKHNKIVRQVIEQDHLGEYNAIFCTYHQLKAIGNFKLRRELLNKFIDRAILIMDESHVAGGTAASLYNKKSGDDGENRPPNRSEYARELISKSQGTVWLSATYAKNSTVLGLYAQKTGIRHAVQSEEMLSHMIEQGGLPLQQALARKLVEAGQYIRHERSYEGIEFLQEVAEVSRDAAEAFSQIMRAIAEFDDLKQPTIAELDDEVSGDGKRVHEKGKKDYGGVTSVNFTSIMWNVINQFLLAIKVDKVADYAIQQLKAGEKVVIALSNTMGSFISDYTEANGIEPGDGIDVNVCDLLDKYLRRSREITITDPNPEIPSERRYITDAELTTEALVHYEQTRDLIAQLREIMGSAPISPIDWLLYRFQDAGFAADEITGRGDRIEYDGVSVVYHRRTATERTPAANNRKIASFNGGGLDVLILNRSACTGVSLHASSKFSDQRKRHMVVAQAELNIDQVMQMLGRIHRTGQVVLPKFTFFSSNLPAEKRPGAILMKKMNSLSANTTANKNSEVDLNELDMLNQYGDRVVVQYLTNNPDINEALLKPIEIGAKTRSVEDEEEDIQKDAMKKVSGRIALLPIDHQEQFYAEVESRLIAAIETAKSKGTYSLEAEHMHLDAVPLRKLEAVPAKAATSPFAEAATLWQMEVNGGRLPRDTKEVLTIVRRFYDLPKTAAAEEIKKAADLHRHKTHENFKEQSTEYYAGKMAKFTNEMKTSATLYQAAINKIDAMEIPDEDKVKKYKRVNDLRDGILEREESDLRDFQKSHQDNYRLLNKILSCITVGEPVQCRVGFEGDQENHYGVVIDVKRNLAYRNVCNPNAWSFVIEFASRLRTISVHLGEVGNWLHIEKLLGMDSIEKHYGVFDQHQTPIREVREVFVGNLLGAYEVFKKGRFVSFDLRDGTTAQGLLMPKTFSGVKQLKDFPVCFASPEDAVAFMSLTGNSLSTKDRKAEIKLQGGMLRINLPGQSKAFKMYWGNSGLLDVLDNEFVTGQSKTMVATTWRVEEAIAALMKISPIEALIGRDHARQVTGQKKIEFEDPQAANVIDLASYVKNKVSLALQGNC